MVWFIDKACLYDRWVTAVYALHSFIYMANGTDRRATHAASPRRRRLMYHDDWPCSSANGILLCASAICLSGPVFDSLKFVGRRMLCLS